MTVLERIKEIEGLLKEKPTTWKDPLIIEQMDANKDQREFLLKAFKVMRGICLKNYQGVKTAAYGSIYPKDEQAKKAILNIEFEERMSK